MQAFRSVIDRQALDSNKAVTRDILNFPRLLRDEYDVIMIGLTKDAEWNRDVVDALNKDHDGKRIVLMTDDSVLAEVVPLLRRGGSNLVVSPSLCAEDPLRESRTGTVVASSLSSRSEESTEDRFRGLSRAEPPGELAFLREFTRNVHQSLDPVEIVDKTLEMVGCAAGVEMITVLLLEEERNFFVTWLKGDPSIEEKTRLQGEIQRSLASWVNGKPSAFDWRLERYDDGIAYDGTPKPEGMQAFPLEFKGERVGVLAYKSGSSGGNKEEIDSLFRSVAEPLALALWNAEKYDRMLRLAETDELTGLPNYRATIRRLRQEVERAVRHNEPLSIILLDLDHFKTINDTLGHATGDLVLREFSRILEGSLRAYDLAGRYAGDEFLLVLPKTTSAHAARIAERIHAEIHKHAWPDALNGNQVTASIGVASREDDDPCATMEDLFRDVDDALYRAKREGRDRTMSA